MLPVGAAPAVSAPAPINRVKYVIDGDTIMLENGNIVRLIQIDAPELKPPECYGAEAAAATKRLLRPKTAVRLYVEPGTEQVDVYGRILRYVVRARDHLVINLRLVRLGAAAPYFYRGHRGRYAVLLEELATRARSSTIGLWRRCPRSQYAPNRGINTGPP